MHMKIRLQSVGHFVSGSTCYTGLFQEKGFAIRDMSVRTDDIKSKRRFMFLNKKYQQVHGYWFLVF